MSYHIKSGRRNKYTQIILDHLTKNNDKLRD